MDSIMKELKRPLFHFSPQSNWLNDPNGLVYWKKIFHLFYQYNPDSTVWGRMHWGCTSSRDCFSWKDSGIALAPDGRIRQIFSGCGVVDENNSSGLFDTEGGCVFLFTGGTVGKGEDPVEEQYLAIFKENNGDLALPFSDPVLKNPGLRDFRDPCVFFVPGQRPWRLLLSCGDHIRFYNSEDLISWTFMGELVPEGIEDSEVIECPSLIFLRNGSEEGLWVLAFSLLDRDSKISRTLYYSGEYDGTIFLPFSSVPVPIDWGPDFYAPQPWSLPYSLSEQSLPRWMGWLNNWKYAERLPETGWRGILSIPRILSWMDVRGEKQLVQIPPPELEQFYSSLEKVVRRSGRITVPLLQPGGYDIQINTIRCGDNFSLVFKESSKREFLIKIEGDHNRLIIDRTGAGFECIREGCLNLREIGFLPSSKEWGLRIIMDFQTVEIFFDKGRITASFILNWHVFPDSLEIIGEKADSLNVTARRLVRNKG